MGRGLFFEYAELGAPAAGIACNFGSARNSREGLDDDRVGIHGRSHLFRSKRQVPWNRGTCGFTGSVLKALFNDPVFERMKRDNR